MSDRPSIPVTVDRAYALPGLGTHVAPARARAWARTYRWFVHLDVAKFFPACDHAVISAQLAHDHPEPWLRELCGVIFAAGVCERRRPGSSPDRSIATRSPPTVVERRR